MKIFREEALFVLALIVLFLFTIGLVVFYSTIFSNTNLGMVKKGIGIVAGDLILRYRERKELVPDGFGELLGAGIYGENGLLLAGFGSAPSRLEKAAGESMVVDNRRQSIRAILFRSVQLSDGRTDGPYRVFAEVDIHEQLRRFTFIKYTSLMGPILLAVVMVTMVALYTRNVKYRRKISLQEQMVHLGEAARTLSHEIKNPLSAIRLQTAYLRRVSPDVNLTSIGIIEEEVDRLANLSKQVANFIRDPRGTPEDIDLCDFIEKLCSRFHHPVVFDGLRKGSLYISADRERLRSVFENMLRNADESMLPETEGGAEASGLQAPIEIRFRTERENVVVEVLDRGCGVAGGKSERLFDPFVTTKVKGSGLGLFIARSFAEAASGSIRLGNRSGGGTAVAVSFPLRKKK